MVGGLFGATFVSTVDEVVGKIFGGVGGAAFVVLGLALVFKSATERITVDSQGITKRSAPSGKQTFQCSWSDVVSYEALSDRQGGREGYINVRSYVLNTRYGELRVNAMESYFGRLHSLILSRIPETVQVKLPQSVTPKSEPFEQMREFRTSTAVANVASIIGYSVLTLLLVGLALFIPLQFPDDPLVKRLAGGAMFLFPALVLSFVVRSRLSGIKTATYKVTSYGVHRQYSDKADDSIPWSEMRSVEFLYQYYDRRTLEERRNQFRFTPTDTYYYAIIGAEGEVFHFSTRMKDFRPFVGSIVDHAPDHVALSLHTDVNSLRPG